MLRLFSICLRFSLIPASSVEQRLDGSEHRNTACDRPLARRVVDTESIDVSVELLQVSDLRLFRRTLNRAAIERIDRGCDRGSFHVELPVCDAREDHGAGLTEVHRRAPLARMHSEALDCDQRSDRRLRSRLHQAELIRLDAAERDVVDRATIVLAELEADLLRRELERLREVIDQA